MVTGAVGVGAPADMATLYAGQVARPAWPGHLNRGHGFGQEVNFSVAVTGRCVPPLLNVTLPVSVWDVPAVSVEPDQRHRAARHDHVHALRGRPA